MNKMGIITDSQRRPMADVRKHLRAVEHFHDLTTSLMGLTISCIEVELGDLPRL